MPSIKIPGVEQLSFALKQAVPTKLTSSLSQLQTYTGLQLPTPSSLIDQLFSSGNPFSFGATFDSNISPGRDLQETLQRADPAMQMDWRVYLPVLPNLGATLPNAPYVNSHVEGIDFQTMQIDSQSYQHSGRTFNRATFRAASPFTVTMYEGVDRAATKYLDAWRKLTVNKDGTNAYPDTYQLQVNVHLMDAKAQVNGSFVLMSCWPSGSTQYNLTSGNSDRIQLRQEFQCDHVFYAGSGSATAT